MENTDFQTRTSQPNPVAPHSIKILRLPEVIERVGIKRASIYQHMEQGSFPKSISLGPRAIGWIESEIDAWLTARVQARQAAKSGSPKNTDFQKGGEQKS